jgi:hypothetical protein
MNNIYQTIDVEQWLCETIAIWQSAGLKNDMFARGGK